MKKSIIAILLLLSIGAHAQSRYVLSFVNGQRTDTKYRVTLKISATQLPFNLGSSNLRFEYPVDILANPTLVSENFPEAQYAATTLIGTNTQQGIVTLNSSSLGKSNAKKLLISKEGAELACLEFDIVNAEAFAQLKWKFGETFPKSVVMTLDANSSTKAQTTKAPIVLPKLNQNTVEASSLMSVSPNPAHDYFVLDYSATASSNASINLTDLYGRTIQTQQVQLIEGQNQIHVDMKDIARGTYIVTLATETQKSLVKISKQ